MREDLSQIQSSKSGVSSDYINEFARILIYMRMLLDMKKPQCEIFNKIELLKKYRERYPSKKYYNVVTDENRETLKQLDIIVDDINTLLQKGKKEEELNHDEIQRVTQLCNEAVRLIRLK